MIWKLSFKSRVFLWLNVLPSITKQSKIWRQICEKFLQWPRRDAEFDKLFAFSFSRPKCWALHCLFWVSWLEAEKRQAVAVWCKERMERIISFDVTSTPHFSLLLPSLQASNYHTSSQMFTNGFYLLLNRTIYDDGQPWGFSRISLVITNIPVSLKSAQRMWGKFPASLHWLMI